MQRISHLCRETDLQHYDMAGEAQDRTTISYTINEGERAKAFDVMFALGEFPNPPYGQQLLAVPILAVLFAI